MITKSKTAADSGIRQKVAGINRNRWPECSGFSDRNKSESVTGMDRNLQILRKQENGNFNCRWREIVHDVGQFLNVNKKMILFTFLLIFSFSIPLNPISIQLIT